MTAQTDTDTDFDRKSALRFIHRRVCQVRSRIEELRGSPEVDFHQLRDLSELMELRYVEAKQESKENPKDAYEILNRFYRMVVYANRALAPADSDCVTGVSPWDPSPLDFS